MERILMKLEIYRQELTAEYNAAMARKVQMEEQKDVNDCNIQRIVGALDAMTKAQAVVNELRQADADIGGLTAKTESLIVALDDAVRKSADAVKAIRKIPPIEVQPVTAETKTTGGTT